MKLGKEHILLVRSVHLAKSVSTVLFANHLCNLGGKDIMNTSYILKRRKQWNDPPCFVLSYTIKYRWNKWKPFCTQFFPLVQETRWCDVSKAKSTGLNLRCGASDHDFGKALVREKEGQNSCTSSNRGISPIFLPITEKIEDVLRLSRFRETTRHTSTITNLVLAKSCYGLYPDMNNKL